MRTATIGVAAGALFISAAISFAGRVSLADEPAPVVEPTLSDHEITGLPASVRPEVLTWERIYALALVHARAPRGAFAPALDPAVIGDDSARYVVADFARFRTDFQSNGLFHDPGADVLKLQGRLLAIAIARRNVERHDAISKFITELSTGRSRGLTRMDVDMVGASLLRARQKLADEIRKFRDGLDELKFLLGLAPHAPVILDRQDLKAFSAVFDSVRDWERGTNRNPAELRELIARLPALGEVIVNGKPILERIERNPDQLEEVLVEASQIAFKSRSERDKGAPPANSGLQPELRVRRRIRDLQAKRLDYQAEQQCYESAARLLDQSFEQLIRPPLPVPVSRSFLVKVQMEQLSQLVVIQNRLIALWTSFRAERLALYRDMGVLPHSDWKLYYADLR